MNNKNIKLKLIHKIMGKSENVYFCMYARNAIYKFSKSFFNKEKNEAIVPYYSCGDEVYAIKKAGYKLVFYNDFFSGNEIMSLINKNTAVVLVNHDFGIYKDISGICKLIKNINHNIKIIEDCAYIFPSYLRNKKMNSDCRIFSIRKHLDIPHGAIIQIKKGLEIKLNFNYPQEKDIIIDNFVYLAKKTGYLKSGEGIASIYKKLGLNDFVIHGPRVNTNYGYELDISNETLDLINGINFLKDLKTKEKRRNRIIKTLDSFKNKNFQIINNKIVTPFLFLRLIKTDSLNVDKKIKNNKIFFTQPFWSYNDFIDDKCNNDIKNMKSSILAIRLDLDISLGDIKKMALIINKS